MSSLHFQINQTEYLKYSRRVKLLEFISVLGLGLLLLLSYFNAPFFKLSDFLQYYAALLYAIMIVWVWRVWQKRNRRQSESEMKIAATEIWQMSPTIDYIVECTDVRSMLIQSKGGVTKTISLYADRWQDAMNMSHYENMPGLESALREKLSDSAEIIETTTLGNFLVYKGGLSWILMLAILYPLRIWLGVPPLEMLMAVAIVPQGVTYALGHLSKQHRLTAKRSSNKKWIRFRAFELLFSAFMLGLSLFTFRSVHHLFTPEHPCNLYLRSQTGCIGFLEDGGNDVVFSNDDNSYIYSPYHGVYKREPGRFLRSKLTQLFPNNVSDEYNYGIAQSPDGSRLHLRSYDKVAVWDISEERIVWSMQSKFGSTGKLSHDGQSLLIQTSRGDYGAGTPSTWQLWDIEANQGLRAFIGISSAEFSPTQPHLAYINKANELILYNFETATTRFRHPIENAPDQLPTITWSDDGTLLALRTVEDVFVYSSETLTLQNKFTWPAPEWESSYLAMTFSPDNTMLVAQIVSSPGNLSDIPIESELDSQYDQPYLRGWSLETGKIIFTQRLTNAGGSGGFESIDFMGDGTTLGINTFSSTFLHDVDKIITNYQKLNPAITSR